MCGAGVSGGRLSIAQLQMFDTWAYIERFDAAAMPLCP